METVTRAKVRAFIESCLRASNDGDDVEDTESLFGGGRLSSVAVTQLVVFLEQDFGVDFAEVGFDIELIDSIAGIDAFVQEVAAQR